MMGRTLVFGFVVGVLLGLTACTSGTTTTTLPATTTAQAASVQPPLGWTKHTGGSAEIYLPPTFDVNLKDSKTVESLKALGGDVASWLSSREAIISSSAIAVADSRTAAAGNAGTVMVSYLGSKTQNTTFQEDVDTLVSMITDSNPGSKVVNRTNLSIGGYEAAEIMVDSAPGFSQLMTVVNGPSGIWAIYMIADTAQMQKGLADFQKSLSTFRIVP
jgi:hypothetical protein